MIKRLKNTPENNQKIAQAIINHKKVNRIEKISNKFKPILKWTRPKQ
tara:strand:+ start:368 stop:508 length:141 start_codon:yes stop_codon:yes gene_type:complete